MKRYTENKATTVTGIIDRYQSESFIGNAERVDLEENQNKGIVRLTTTDGYMYKVTLEEDKIYSVSQGKDDGEPYPRLTLEQLPLQGIENEKIQIKVTAEVKTTLETTEIVSVERIDNKEKKDYVEGGVIFEVEQNGTYTFSATTNKGKSKVAKIVINVTQPKDKISIFADNTEVTNQDVNVTIKYGEMETVNADKYQYKIGTSGNWQTTNEQETTVKITENTVIVARYFDGVNSFKVESYNIQNIDKDAPNSFEYTIVATTNSITITGNTEDKGSTGTASGNIGIAKYEYSKDNGVSWQTSNTFTELTTGTYPVKMRAIDKARNVTNGISSISKVEAESVALGTVSGSTITITGTPTAATKGDVTINITFADNGLTRQYKKSIDSTWISISGTTASFTASSNISVAVRYTDGINYFNGTTYNVQNIDKVAPNAFTIGVSNITVSGFTITGASTTDTGTAGCSTGNIGIVKYEYFVNSVNKGSTNVTGLADNTTYSVFVRATDKAGNTRDSNTISVKTLIEETKPYLPAGSTVLNSNVNTGYTIKDKNSNEWVWVVVPRSITVSASNDTAIYTALENYATEYRETRYYTDTWYNGCGLTEAQYNTNKSKTLNSIKTYGGFYIGRYELGTNTIRTANVTLAKPALIQPNKYPYNYTTCSQAQELCSGLSPEANITSSLMYGIQWDLTLKFMEEKGTELGITTADRQAKLKKDSSTWGNYYNVTFSIIKGSYSTDYGSTYTKVTGTYTKPVNIILLTTGATERNKVLNIYDIAGNQFEWTLEKSTNTSGSCVSRGGGYGNLGSSKPGFGRNINTVSNSNYDVSSRTALWK